MEILVLVLGICSIAFIPIPYISVFALPAGIIGIVIALVENKNNPTSLVAAGFVCSIIGISINIVGLVCGFSQWTATFCVPAAFIFY